MRSLSSPRAVSMMIGTCAVDARRRSRRQTSIPLTPSIIQSRIDQVRSPLLRQDQRFVAVGGSHDLIALPLEVPDEEIGERAVVFDQQEHGLGHCASP